MRRLEVLEEKRARIERILLSAGVESGVAFAIPDSGFEEKLRWVEEDIQRCGRAIERIRSEMKLLSEEEGVAERRAILESPEKLARMREAMEEKIAGCLERERELRRALDTLFSRRRSKR